MSEMLDRAVKALERHFSVADRAQCDHVDAAREVLEALREPTNEMFRAFMSVNAEPLTSGGERMVWEGDSGQFVASLNAMINEALK